MAALAGLALLAHGGVGGAIVEALLVLSIAGVFLAVYLRERRAAAPATTTDTSGRLDQAAGPRAVFGHG